jgi:hypothetical protein
MRERKKKERKEGKKKKKEREKECFDIQDQKGFFCGLNVSPWGYPR